MTITADSRIEKKIPEQNKTAKKIIQNSCKYCDSSNIHLHQIQEEIPHKGKTLKVTQQLSICSSCNKEFTSKAQNILNDISIRDAIKFADGLLSSKEIYEARSSLGLTQEKAALVFGGGRNAFSKYERAEVSQSVAMDRLIRVCLHHPEVYAELLRNAGVEITKTHLDSIQSTTTESIQNSEPTSFSKPIQYSISEHHTRPLAHT
ncbi:MAG: hypothetical protein COA42_12410 [Alteromonadaceae bacterium]|nr:MAG: hypothetical protein COA42_12410 [Alteromonadaceae bacterium]